MRVKVIVYVRDLASGKGLRSVSSPSGTMNRDFQMATGRAELVAISMYHVVDSSRDSYKL